MFYLKVRKEDNVILDCISFQHEGYTEVQLDDVPVGINGGWFKFIDGEVLEVPELKPYPQVDEIEGLKSQNLELQQKQELMQKAIDDLIFGGML